jgi:hypothetical protein
MSTSGISPIRILLLDDNPKGLTDPQGIPRVTEDYEDDHFSAAWYDVRWLATPGEAREFRDLSRQIALVDPIALGLEGWVPDLIVADYCLTAGGANRPVSQRLAHQPDLIESSSAVAALRKLASRFGVRLYHECEEFMGGIPAEDENFGCFLGGLLLTTFSDHPCALVASTVRQRSDVHGSYTAFFQWALQDEGQGSLRAGEKYGRWKPIIQAGVQRIRDRIVRLASASLLQISLEDLLALAAMEEQPTLAVSSRYGRRMYPVAGLFMDNPPENVTEAASEWANDVLQSAWEAQGTGASAHEFEETLSSLHRGCELARQLWDAYCDDDRLGRRLRLSELLARDCGKGLNKEPLTRVERRELSTLSTYFDVRDVSRAVPACGRRFMDLRHLDFDDRAKRWAVLLITVRILHDRYRAVQIARNIRGQRERKTDIDPALEAPLTPNDLYLGLFPIAQTPVVLPWHTERSDPAASWSRYIKALGLDLKEILTGRGSRSATPAERVVLRMFAESVGAEDNDWGPEEWKRDPLAWRVLHGDPEGD